MQSVEQGLERAFELEERQREDRLVAVRNAMAGRGSDICITCGDPISAARRNAVPSAIRCTECQADVEFEQRGGR